MNLRKNISRFARGVFRAMALLSNELTLTRPLRRKLRMRWFLDISKVKESRKVPIFCRISDESALICNFLRNGRVRVKHYEFRLRLLFVKLNNQE